MSSATYTHASNLALVLTNTLSTASYRRMRDPPLLKYDIIIIIAIICYFSHDCAKHPQWSDFWIRHWVNY